MIWNKLCLGLAACMVVACHPKEAAVEQKAYVRNQIQSEEDSVSIESEFRQNKDQLHMNINVINRSSTPIYIRGDYYYVEQYGNDKGVTLPDDNWSGNVISLVRPSNYGSIGQNQVGPFPWRKPLFLRVRQHDSSRIILELKLPNDLIRKGVVGDSFLVSIPYWRIIDSISSQAIVRNEVTPLILSENMFAKDSGTRHVAYTMVGDSIVPNTSYISTMNSFVTRRLAYWGMIR